MLRSRRLEQLLGAPIAELTSEHLHAAVRAKVQESHDLDWKRDPYTRSDKDKKTLRPTRGMATLPVVSS